MLDCSVTQASAYPTTAPCPTKPDSLRVLVDSDTEYRLDPGEPLRVAQYGDRLYRYVHWTSDRRVLFRAVGWGSPVPAFTVGTDRVATDFAAGDLTPASCNRWTIIRETLACLRDRDWIALEPPEKGDVPAWKQTTRTQSHATGTADDADASSET